MSRTARTFWIVVANTLACIVTQGLWLGVILVWLAFKGIQTLLE